MGAKGEMIVKAMLWEQDDIDNAKRTITFIISSTTKDRANEIVDIEGANIENYKKNAVFLWGHNHSIPAIGRALWIKKVGKLLKMKVEFAETQFASEIYGLYKEGFLNACSIGFLPDYDKIERPKDDKNGVRAIYREWELLEVSGCNVPCNQEAIAVARSIVQSEDLRKELGLDEEDVNVKTKDLNEKATTEPEEKEENPDEKAKYKCECIKCGWTTTTDKHCNTIKCDKCGGEMRRAERPGPGRSEEDTIEKPGWDETENEHRYRLKDPKLFDEFRVKTIQKKPKVYGIYGKLKGKDEWQWQSLRFPKKDWTLANAKKWYEEHKDGFKSIEPIQTKRLPIFEDEFVNIAIDKTVEAIKDVESEPEKDGKEDAEDGKIVKTLERIEERLSDLEEKVEQPEPQEDKKKIILEIKPKEEAEQPANEPLTREKAMEIVGEMQLKALQDIPNLVKGAIAEIVNYQMGSGFKVKKKV